MKKTLHIDEGLLAEAREACGAGTDTETVRQGLQALVRSAAYQRARALLGTEAGPLRDVPRTIGFASRRSFGFASRRSFGFASRRSFGFASRPSLSAQSA
jgi:Arc/MetJ family transcription regulator